MARLRRIDTIGPDLKPFRWNIAKREQIGRLLEAPSPAGDVPGLHDTLRAVSAKILARSDDSDLVFVGRSVESFYDYLSGIFHDVPNAPSLTLLP